MCVMRGILFDFARGMCFGTLFLLHYCGIVKHNVWCFSVSESRFRSAQWQFSPSFCLCGFVDFRRPTNFTLISMKLKRIELNTHRWIKHSIRSMLKLSVIKKIANSASLNDWIRFRRQNGLKGTEIQAMTRHSKVLN